MADMSTPETAGFVIYVAMTLVFFAWVAYVAFTK